MSERADALAALRVELERTWERHTVRSALLQEEFAEIDSPGKVLLKAIYAAPGSRSSEIADRCGMSRPVVSRRIASMVRAGLIEGATDPEDRRASLLSLTPLGRRTVEGLASDATAALDHMVQDFTLTDLRRLQELLHRLNDRAAEQQDARPPTTPNPEEVLPV
jgi:DNA-binding MarR family transcriptional regulator